MNALRRHALLGMLIVSLFTSCERLLIDKEPFEQFEGKTTDPDQVLISTRDVDLFWQAYTAAGQATDKAAHWQQTYLDKVSPTVRATLLSANRTGASFDQNTTQRTPRFFGSIREVSTNGIRAQQGAIRAGLRRMKAVYPDVRFSGIYFGMGLFNNGGKSLGSGVYIGTEFFCQSPTTDLTELNAYTRSVMNSPDHLAPIVTHEMAHQQQRYGNTSTLLAAAIAEGSADFLAELASGSVATGSQTYTFGLANERAVWQAFSKDMTGTVWTNWLYNGFQTNAYNFPPDMGYFVGYRICKAYYGRATDKTQALRDMLTTRDAPAFLAQSGYAQQWK